MFKTIALTVLSVVALAVVSVLAYAATKPDTFQIARSVRINAPAEKIFPLINDLHRQLTWIPFDRDPAAKRSFSSNAAGKGASYAWDGNRDVGAGKIEIIDESAPSKVAMTLDMTRPMAAHNLVDFTLAPGESAGTTDVTWAMHGAQPFLGKLISTFIDCEKMVGDDFDKGLAKLKMVAESQAAQ
jgi:uncharacterized protein YndB with AHSA1/START domain